MRTKDQHMAELFECDWEAFALLVAVRATRMNVPLGSVVHEQLKQAETNLDTARGQLNYCYRYLEQHGNYGGKEGA